MIVDDDDMSDELCELKRVLNSLFLPALTS